MGLNSQAENYCPDEVVDIELYDIDGSQLFNDDEEKTPMTIGVIGADSDEAIKTRRGNTNRRLQAGARAKVTAEGLEAQDANYLATLTKRWNITLDGEKPALSKAKAVELYSNPRLAFIREQVDTAIGERATFLKASPTN